MSSAPLPATDRYTGSPKPAAVAWDPWIYRFARVALGAAFLSGIASRFGWWGKGVGYGNFENFLKYTAQVNSFMPASTIPFLGWSATIAELFLGVALVLGIWRLWVALGSALLLMLFGTAMAISFGIKEPLDYSVFSASAAALLLAQSEHRHGRKKMSPELKTFIDSLVGPTPEERRDKIEPAYKLIRRNARKVGTLFTLFADALEEMGPYTCELRSVGKIRSAVAKYGTHGDVIGHHGLA